MELMNGVRAHSVDTDRLTMHVYEAGPEDGTPVVLIHGNLVSGRFYEHIMAKAPAGYRYLAPDMRSFGRSDATPIDATRGVRDWSDDTKALLDALGITATPHLVGWSTGGAAIANHATDHGAASLTFIDPVSPYGYGGTHLDGRPCYDDWAGTGGGTGNPEFAQLIADKNRGDDNIVSPRNVMNTSFWSPEHREPPEREALLLDEVLMSVIGDDGYPGDMTPSDNWPNVAPGTRGILNALSGKYLNWADIVDLDPKPPILWTHGTADIVVADGSAWEMGTLGKMEIVPGWPGEHEFAPQPMVTQIRNVLADYADRGGDVTTKMFEGSGHGPHFDAADEWMATFFAFLQANS